MLEKRVVAKKDADASRAKSGVRVMKPGEVLFNEGDQADSLYIVQKGQLRLFLKKGRGFVDIAVLHPGEVLGEMAYFDEKSSTRSCSASSIVTTELVEISFNAFGKTMKNLNPWFKTIINTLAQRLRSTNAKVKELETGQVSMGRGDKASQYKFFNNVDVVRLLSMIYMVFRAHAKTEEGSYVINLKTVKYYATDIFAISEAKVLEFINLLEEEGSVEILSDANKLPNVIRTKNYTKFYEWMAFLQGERFTADNRKIVFHERCEKILSRAYTLMDPTKVDKQTGLVPVNLSKIFEEFKAQNLEIIPEDLGPAVDIGLAEEILVNEGILTSRMNYAQLQKVFFPVRFMNRVTELNSTKASSRY